MHKVCSVDRKKVDRLTVILTHIFPMDYTLKIIKSNNTINSLTLTTHTPKSIP